MFYNSRYFIDSNGDLIEVRQDPPGSWAVGVLAILMGIFYMLQQTWLWLQSHYILLGVFAIFSFIAWFGWANLVYRKKIEVSFRGGLQGFVGLLAIVGLFNGSLSGYERAANEGTLRKEMRGEWKQVDAEVTLKITDRKIDIESAETGIRMDLNYQATMSGNDALLLTCSGTVHSGKKNEKPQPTSIAYLCQMHEGRLVMMETSSRTSYSFVRK